MIKKGCMHVCDGVEELVSEGVWRVHLEASPSIKKLISETTAY